MSHSFQASATPGVPWPTDTSVPAVVIVVGIVALMCEHAMADRGKIRSFPDMLAKNFAIVKAAVLNKEVHPDMKVHVKASMRMDDIKVWTAVRVTEVAGAIWMCVAAVQLCIVLWFGIGAFDNKQQFLLVIFALYGVCRYIQTKRDHITPQQVDRVVQTAYLILAIRMFTFPCGSIYFATRTVCTTCRVIIGFLLLNHQTSLFWNAIITTGSFVQYVVTSDTLGTDRLPGHFLTYAMFEFLAIVTMWVCHYYVQMFVEGWAISLADAEEMPTSHKLVKKMLSVLCDVDFVLDEDLHFTESSEKLAHFFRTSRRSLSGSCFTDFLEAKDREMFHKFHAVGANNLKECAPGIDILSKTVPACLNLSGRDAQRNSLKMNILYVCFPMRGRAAHYLGVRETGARPELSAACPPEAPQPQEGEQEPPRSQDGGRSEQAASDAVVQEEVPLDDLQSVSVVFNPFSVGRDIRSVTFTFAESAAAKHRIANLSGWMPKAMYEKVDTHIQSFINEAFNQKESKNEPLDTVALHNPVSDGALIAKSVDLDFVENDDDDSSSTEEDDEDEPVWLRLDLANFTDMRTRGKSSQSSHSSHSSSKGCGMRRRRGTSVGTPSVKSTEHLRSIREAEDANE